MYVLCKYCISLICFVSDEYQVSLSVKRLRPVLDLVRFSIAQAAVAAFVASPSLDDPWDLQLQTIQDTTSTIGLAWGNDPRILQVL